MKYKVSLNLSEQQIVDCSKVNFGCRGGYLAETFAYIKAKGIVEESDYSYKASSTACRLGKNVKAVVNITDYKSFNYVADEDIMKILTKIGPVTIGMNGSGKLFSSYSSGIYTGSISTCNPGTINHAVVLVRLFQEKYLI